MIDEKEKNFDKKLVRDFDFESDFDEQKLRNFLKKANMPLDLTPEQALLKLGCGGHINNQFTINNAGILFFAHEPERFIGESYITCVRYHGNSKVSAIDRKDLHGDLLTLVDEAEKFVKRNTRLAFKVQGFKRIDIEEYPYDAIREAIINAVCHKNYNWGNIPFVNIFDSKIEVISTGSIPNGLTLKDVEGKSVPRNPVIAKLFRKAGYIEKPGTGLKRMAELMMMKGLRKPVFDASRAFFEVVFYGPGDRILDLVKPYNVIDLRDLGLNIRQIKTLNYLQEHKVITSQEYAKRFGINDRTARRDLEKLAGIGYVEKYGKTKATQYLFPENLPPLPEK